MALGSHLITVRRLKKYIDDVIGKKANLPDTSKTIIGNISKINTDLSDIGEPIFLGSASNINTNGVSLNDNMTNYKNLVLVSQSVHGGHMGSCIIPVSFFKSTTSPSAILYTGYYDGLGGFYYSSDSSVGTTRFANYNFNAWVYGIK